MNSGEARRKFLSFFAEKRNHKIVSSSSLLSDDPTVLLTTAGVQQFKNYYTGKADPMKDFGSRRLASIQKCFRTSDIDEVGDKSHLTFFEMLGNFSFGDYWKEKAIKWAYEFLTEELKLPSRRLSATYLKGDKDSLMELKKFFPVKKIQASAKKDNFWGPTGEEGPCGPTVEFYVDGMEVWNLVFNQYYCRKNGSLVPLNQAGGVLGVDTGMGLERLTAVLNGTADVYQTDLLKPLFDLLPADWSDCKRRIAADHGRGIVFLIADGVYPANKEAGYVLRRLIRRLVTLDVNQKDKLTPEKKEADLKRLLLKTIKIFGEFYPKLEQKKKEILTIFNEERQRFDRALKRGLKELAKLKKVDGESAFKLYESYGLPFEVIKGAGGGRAKNLKRKDFELAFAEHRKRSQASAERKFGGHGGVRPDLHTATHLLQQALRDVLGNQVEQRGSDINERRARFDFSFPRKLTSAEIKKVEDIVNQKIKEDLPVNFKEMPLKEAKKTGALHFFETKYPNKVKVYYIGDSLGNAYSKEFCGGPHVNHTGEIGKFKITKEESVSAGVRRIKAVLLS